MSIFSEPNMNQNLTHNQKLSLIGTTSGIFKNSTRNQRSRLLRDILEMENTENFEDLTISDLINFEY